MSARYASYLPAEARRRTFRAVNPLLNLEPSWNVAPTQMAPVVRRHPETGERQLDLLQWGLLPYFTKDSVRARRPINARAETVATSRMFRRAFELRRAIVPADAFYGWRVVEGGKQLYAICRPVGPMAFAGPWAGFRWSDGNVTRSFTIITTNATPDVADLHDRMPGDPGTGGIGRSGWAIRHRCCIHHQPEGCGSGRWIGGSTARGTTAGVVGGDRRDWIKLIPKRSSWTQRRGIIQGPWDEDLGRRTSHPVRRQRLGIGTTLDPTVCAAAGDTTLLKSCGETFHSRPSSAMTVTVFLL